jgi:colicin import membrane protein
VRRLEIRAERNSNTAPYPGFPSNCYSDPDINPEIRERILNAAQQLFEAAGRLELPTVDAVRRLSKTNMNDASAVMKEWRRLQIVSASAAVVSVPDRVQQASQSALSAPKN